MYPQAEDTLYPIAILIDELRHEDTNTRLGSIKKLSTIALALGEERTRAELLPFLTENPDDEDEVLLTLAEQLGDFVGYVGGPNHAHCLLPPLTQLAAIEETVVREKAVESLNKVCEAMSNDHVLEYFVPLITSLAEGEWFTSRVSACALYAAAYAKVPASARPAMREQYKALAKDETPMVRRSATQQLGAFAKSLEQSAVIEELLPLFSALTADDQDSVRLLAVESCAALAKLLPRDECAARILPVVQEFARDRSWRVRYMVAQQIGDLSESMGADLTRAELLSGFQALLGDAEAEVRTAAAAKVTVVAQLVGAETTLSALLPAMSSLANDASQHVRAALAGVVMGLAPVLGKSATIDNLLPVFLALLKDEFPDVRLSIISELQQVNQVIGVDLLWQTLLPTVRELAEDCHWRVRLAIIEYVPLLAKQLGVDFFRFDESSQKSLSDLCLAWLSDSVYAIRDAATKNLRELAETFGAEWAVSNIVPKLVELVKNPHYLYRITILTAIEQIAPVVGTDVTCTTFMPVLLAASRDAVPNIKFNTAKIMQELLPVFGAVAVDSQVKPCLKELAEDADMDVAFFANQALAACS